MARTDEVPGATSVLEPVASARPAERTLAGMVLLQVACALSFSWKANDVIYL
jgi:hypothetical protein